MKEFVVFILSLCIFLEGECQKLTPLSISKLNFNSDAEANLFDAIEKKQPYSPAALFMIIDSAVSEKSIREAEQAINGFTERLRMEKPGKTFSKTVQNHFTKTHKEFLIKYRYSAYFNEIFESGTYNCVTASALYAMLFDQLDIRYSIKETPTHVYLIVNPGKENIMVETTDPQGEIVVITDEMKVRYLDYLKAEKLISDADLKSNSTNDLFYHSFYSDSDISLLELAGIQYYNRGIELINKQDFGKALVNLEKSYTLYPGDRTAFLIITCLEQFVRDEVVSHYDQNKEYFVKYVNYTRREDTREVMQNHFEKVARELLLNQNDKVHYESFYSYLNENITDSAAVAGIQFINYFYLGTAEGLKSNSAKSIAYFTKAVAINPNNLVLQSLVAQVVLQQISRYGEIKEENILDSMDHYVQLFPFLSENPTILDIYPHLYLQLAGNHFNRNKGETGGKYISLFESFYKTHPDTELKDELIGWAYGEESSYYIRKGNKAKAKEMLLTGLKYSPDNEHLKTKLSYLKYF